MPTQPHNWNAMSDAAKATFAKLIVTQKNEGLREALAVLLKQTEFRFCGIWLFQDDKAKPVIHVDREQPETVTVPQVGATATYCSLMRESGKPFATSNAMADPRLASHVARTNVLSYAGVPVIDLKGDVIGSLCFYDIRPRDAGEVEEMLMASISRYLSLNGLVPPYNPAA